MRVEAVTMMTLDGVPDKEVGWALLWMIERRMIEDFAYALRRK